MGGLQVQSWVEFVANDLCLDFVNTVNDWSNPTEDQLEDIAGLRAWANAAGLETVHNDKAVTRRDLRRAHDVRASLHRLMSATIDGDPLPAEPQRELLHLHAEGIRHATLKRQDQHVRPSWTDTPYGPTITWRVADAAVALLRTGDLSRLGRCPSCCWLFYDTSKNRSRRWCSMATCGSREKARRYYQRRYDD